MTDPAATESGKAYAELLAVLTEAGERWLGPEYGVESEHDLALGHRNLMHLVQGALFSYFESDPAHPDFRRIVSPTRKFTGDNPDALYFDCPLDHRRTYRLSGNTDGAVYTSFTVEVGAEEGRYAMNTAGVLRDTDMDIAPDGSYEIVLGGPERPGNWLALPDGAARLTTRHYYEQPEPVAADQLAAVPLSIEPLDPTGPPPPWDDAAVAAGIRRVINQLRGKTIDQPPNRMALASIPWRSEEANTFPAPMVPGNMAYAAFDAAYSLAPYDLGPEEALVITGRWPTCRFANVCLWNRFSQTYDYVNRPVYRNRANTSLEPDGSWRMVLAHRDPGLPNWIDTEGEPTGTVFWRFFLPEGPIETPQATVVRHSDL